MAGKEIDQEKAGRPATMAHLVLVTREIGAMMSNLGLAVSHLSKDEKAEALAHLEDLTKKLKSFAEETGGWVFSGNGGIEDGD